MKNPIENPSNPKEPEHWKELAGKLQTLVDQHGGKPAHMLWTIEELQKRGDIEKIKSDYF